ncbi:MAG: coproporphyrinogen III oxidase family protein [Verrucomicrobiaceae bacterium]|nr:MAG: coproporphyrinogen III oxidase family protein [Verrucomicrobiaceae bacterium]
MTLTERLQHDAFQGYAYAYPHKMAYGPLQPPVPLETLWSEEDRDALFLYVHLPFCEMRCGFCNLFTTTGAKPDLVTDYLGALERQMRVVGASLDSHRFARAAFGGGTPTFLSETELERLFAMTREHLGGFAGDIPISFEMSPGTVTETKLKLLREQGVTRASIGVQSFLLEETKALGRPQQREHVMKALTLMRNSGFRVLNIDLIYGIPDQTPQSWEFSLREALQFEPEELFLYPLYVRPLTGLEKLHREPSDLRLELFRRGRDFLLAQGYEQISMRLFRRKDLPAEQGDGPVYCCQEDGMVGFGAGARSYTKALHYSTEYAVGRSGVQEIIRGYIESPDSAFAVADYGCVLEEEEQRRRYVIKSLLRQQGLDFRAYLDAYGADPLNDFPQLRELLDLDLATLQGGHLILTAGGMERSDTIGPWLFSSVMTERMEQFELV